MCWVVEYTIDGRAGRRIFDTREEAFTVWRICKSLGMVRFGQEPFHRPMKRRM